MQIPPYLRNLLVFSLSLTLYSTSARAQHDFDVISYDAEISLDRADTSLEGRVTMYARATKANPVIEQHALYLTIDEIYLRGQPAQRSTIDTMSGGAYHVSATNVSIAAGDTFSLTTIYHGKPLPEGGVKGKGWGGVTASGGMMFAMGVGFTAPYVSCTRHWLPCYDEPNDKADSVRLRFICALGDKVASNGSLVVETEMNAQRYTEWLVTHPIATYLLTFATGPYLKFSVENPLGVPFDYYCLPTDTTKSRIQFNGLTRSALLFYDSLFGHYPFEKVGYVVAPIGSMEHQTMVTIARQAMSANNTTGAHELAHQWWGDWVTCKDFNDPWLNEGFATFCESLIEERFYGVAEYWKKQHANIKNAIFVDEPVAMYGAPYALNHNTNYPRLIYDKGAAVLGMLRYYLGDQKFFDAIRHYGSKHAYSTATSFDLQHDIEESSGEELGWFFREWVFRGGTPKLNVSYHYPTPSSVRLNVEQSFDSIGKQYYRLPVILEARYHDGTRDRVQIWVDSIRTTALTANFSKPIDSIALDPDGVLIKLMNTPVLSVGMEPANNGKVRIDLDSNPVVAGKLKASISSSKSLAGVRVSLVDASGREVLLCPIPQGKHVLISQDVSSLSAGRYLLVASQKGMLSTAAVVIEH